MRKIILPTDFSENSYNALKYAVELFKHETSEIHLLHAYADEVYNYKGMLDQELLEKLKKEAHERAEANLATLTEKIKEYSPNPKHKFISIAKFGSLVDEVNDLVEGENADIVVMGTRGEPMTGKLPLEATRCRSLNTWFLQCFAFPKITLTTSQKIFCSQTILWCQSAGGN